MTSEQTPEKENKTQTTKSFFYKSWKRFWWRFDRSFSSNQALKPLLWVISICIFFTFLIWLISLIWPQATLVENGSADTGNFNRIDEVIHLMFDAGNYPINSPMPHTYQFIIAIIGSMLVTALMISTFSNMLSNRAASHRKGFLRYFFSNHILILGGSKMVVGILKSIANNSDSRKKEVLILTNKDAETLWVYITSLLSKDERKRLILTIYNGERNMEKTLTSCQVELASEIYIIGEDDENEHDSINVDCWEKTKQLRKNSSKNIAQCFLVLERNASAYLFNFQPQLKDSGKLETAIVNLPESIAQQIMVGDNEEWKACVLDRNVIDKDSTKYVHLAIEGMTQMGYAMATTAAHLCHFPNFDEKSQHPIRTKITFIDENADREMKLFIGRYPSLFDLSHSSYRDGKSKEIKHQPKTEYGDFLDVEWEFLKGSTLDSWVKTYLIKCKEDPDQVLTLAFCESDPDSNIAKALYLPNEFHKHIDNIKDLNDQDPYILVYQPANSALMKTSQEIGKFKNILPFGTVTGSIDVKLIKRINAAKRINYLIKNKDLSNDPAQLDKLWEETSFANKMSSIYSANSIYTKQRCMGINNNNAQKILSSTNSKTIDLLCKMEHARWNIEKLIVGFYALPSNEREKLREPTDSDKQERINDRNYRKERDYLKQKEYKHYCIAPYDEIEKDKKKNDRSIVRNQMKILWDPSKDSNC